MPGARPRVTEPIPIDAKVHDAAIEEFDTIHPIVDEMPPTYFEQIVSQFLATGRARSGQVGRALCDLLPAPDLVEFAIEKMEREFGGR